MNETFTTEITETTEGNFSHELTLMDTNSKTDNHREHRKHRKGNSVNSVASVVKFLIRVYSCSLEVLIVFSVSSVSSVVYNIKYERR